MSDMGTFVVGESRCPIVHIGFENGEMYVEADRTNLKVPRGKVAMRVEAPDGSTVLAWQHRVTSSRSRRHRHDVPVIEQVVRFSEPEVV